MLTLILQQKARSAEILRLEGTSPFNGFLPIIFSLQARAPGLRLYAPVSQLLALAAKAFLFFLAQSECPPSCYSGPAIARRLAELSFNSLASGLFRASQQWPGRKLALPSLPGAGARGSRSHRNRPSGQQGMLGGRLHNLLGLSVEGHKALSGGLLPIVAWKFSGADTRKI